MLIWLGKVNEGNDGIISEDEPSSINFLKLLSGLSDRNFLNWIDARPSNDISRSLFRLLFVITLAKLKLMQMTSVIKITLMSKAIFVFSRCLWL